MKPEGEDGVWLMKVKCGRDELGEGRKWGNLGRERDVAEASDQTGGRKGIKC